MVDQKVSNKEIPKILTKPLPQILDEMEDIMKVASEAARKAEEAALKAEEATEAARDAAAAAKRTPLSWEMIVIIIVTVLGSIFAAMAVSLGLGLGIWS